MFCPKCGAEYRQGFTVCSDCGVKLVHEHPIEREPRREPQMNSKHHLGGKDLSAFVEILSTVDPGEIAFIKSMLDAEGVEYFFKGEHAHNMAYLFEPVRLMVRRDQAEEALRMIEEVDLSDEAERAYEKGEERE